MQDIKVETAQKYLTVKQLAGMGFIPEGGIRHLIFSNPDFNNQVVRRLGKKILIDLQAFYRFVDQREGGK